MAKKKLTLKRMGVLLVLGWMLAWLLIGAWSCFNNLRSDADEANALYAGARAAWLLAVEEAQREIQDQHLQAAAAEALFDRLTLPFLRCRQDAAAAHKKVTEAEKDRIDGEGIVNPQLTQAEQSLLRQARTTCLQAGVHPASTPVVNAGTPHPESAGVAPVDGGAHPQVHGDGGAAPPALDGGRDGSR